MRRTFLFSCDFSRPNTTWAPDKELLKEQSESDQTHLLWRRLDPEVLAGVPQPSGGYSRASGNPFRV